MKMMKAMVQAASKDQLCRPVLPWWKAKALCCTPDTSVWGYYPANPSGYFSYGRIEIPVIPPLLELTAPWEVIDREQVDAELQEKMSLENAARLSRA